MWVVSVGDNMSYGMFLWPPLGVLPGQVANVKSRLPITLQVRIPYTIRHKVLKFTFGTLWQISWRLDMKQLCHSWANATDYSAMPREYCKISCSIRRLTPGTPATVVTKKFALNILKSRLIVTYKVLKLWSWYSVYISGRDLSNGVPNAAILTTV